MKQWNHGDLALQNHGNLALQNHGNLAIGNVMLSRSFAKTTPSHHGNHM